MLSVSFFSPVLLFFLFLLYHIFCFSGTFNQRFPSQRPSEISETIFSQCNNFITMRLTNPNDQNYVKRLLPDTMGQLIDKMPTLKSGECLLIGDAVVIPSIVKVEECNPKPSSNDIPYLDLWKKEWNALDVQEIIDYWRK